MKKHSAAHALRRARVASGMRVVLTALEAVPEIPTEMLRTGVSTSLAEKPKAHAPCPNSAILVLANFGQGINLNPSLSAVKGGNGQDVLLPAMTKRVG